MKPLVEIEIRAGMRAAKVTLKRENQIHAEIGGKRNQAFSLPARQFGGKSLRENPSDNITVRRNANGFTASADFQ